MIPSMVTLYVSPLMYLPTGKLLKGTETAAWSQCVLTLARDFGTAVAAVNAAPIAAAVSRKKSRRSIGHQIK